MDKTLDKSPEDHEYELRNLQRKFAEYSCNASRKRKDAESIHLEKMARLLYDEHKELSHFMRVSKNGLHGIRSQQVKSKMGLQLIHNDSLQYHANVVHNEVKEFKTANDTLYEEVVKFTNIVNNRINFDERKCRSEFRLKNMENKLDTDVKRFNATNLENAALRDDITDQLNNRAIFTKIWNGMIGRLEKGRMLMTTLLSQIDNVSTQREQMIEKIACLNENGYQDLVTATRFRRFGSSDAIHRIMLHMRSMVTDMQYHQKKLDELYFLHDFIRVKNSMRLTAEEEIKVNQEEEKERSRSEEMKYREKKLDEIFDFTGKSMICEVIETFPRDEVYNVTLFKRLCEIQSDCFLLTSEINKIEPQILQRTHTIEDRRARRYQKVLSLREQIHHQKEANRSIKHQVHESDRSSSIIFNEIHNMFESCALNVAPLLRLLGKEYTVTKHNYLWYMTAMASYVNEYLQLAYKDQHDKRASKRQLMECLKTKQEKTTGDLSLTSTKWVGDKKTDTKQFVIKEIDFEPHEKCKKILWKGDVDSITRTDEPGKDKIKKCLVKKDKSIEQKNHLRNIIRLPCCKPFEPVAVRDVVAYTPCAYCQEKWVFAQVSNDLTHPLTLDEAMRMLTSPPHNTPYGINTKTNVKIIHTARKVKLAEMKENQ